MLLQRVRRLDVICGAPFVQRLARGRHLNFHLPLGLRKRFAIRVLCHGVVLVLKQEVLELRFVLGEVRLQVHLLGVNALLEEVEALLGVDVAQL